MKESIANNEYWIMENPLVSIVIPIYNVEKYLAECLDSVLEQTYTNIEVICVNDGSPDRSDVILQDYSIKDKRIKVIEIENQGLSGARNVGTYHCSGDYLMYLDSDDWVDADTIEIAVKNAVTANADVVLWNYVKEYSNGSRPVDVFKVRMMCEGSSFIQLHQHLIGLTGKQLRNPAQCDSISTAWGKLYRTEIIKDNNIQFVDTKVIGTEDLLFNASYFNYCQSAVVLPNRFNHYRKQNSGTLARRYKPRLLQQWTELHRRLDYICAGKDYLEQSVSNRTALSLIGLGINEMLATYSLAKKYENLKAIVKTPRFRDSLARMETSEMPLHWKVFFESAKNRRTIVLLFLLYVITAITAHH